MAANSNNSNLELLNGINITMINALSIFKNGMINIINSYNHKTNIRISLL